MKKLDGLMSVVRRALLAREVLRASLAVAVIAGALALVAVLTVPGLPRLPLLAVLALGPLLGAVLARRRRPGDADVVLFIDGKLAAGESIVTAWELARTEGGAPPSTLAQAEGKLRAARARDVRPRMVPREWMVLPLAAAAWTATMLVLGASPPRRIVGTALVRTDEVDALRRIERLPELTRNPEQQRSSRRRRARPASWRVSSSRLEQRTLDRVRRFESSSSARHREIGRASARDAATEAMASEPGCSARGRA